jgi:elongation factor 1-beta
VVNVGIFQLSINVNVVLKDPKMAKVVMKLKVMPESLETDLEKIKEEIKTKAEIHEISEEPIAFGLKAILITVIWPEDKNPDTLESSIKEIRGVNSVEVFDVRRLL